MPKSVRSSSSSGMDISASIWIRSRKSWSSIARFHFAIRGQRSSRKARRSEYSVELVWTGSNFQAPFDPRERSLFSQELKRFENRGADHRPAHGNADRLRGFSQAERLLRAV